MIKLQESGTKGVKIKVLGIGGGGSNSVRYMAENNLENVELIVANTDIQALNTVPVSMKIQLGKHTTKGQGAGGDPEIGKKSAEESIEELKNILKDADMVFLTAGLGGGTGSGGIPVVARLCKEELGILTCAVVTLPFTYEGEPRQKKAHNALEELKKNVHSYIVIPNEKLLSSGGEALPFRDAFIKVDEVLYHAVRGIVNVIYKTQYVNVDFADVRNVLKNGGKAIMGIGVSEGENRAIEAVRDALRSPLIEAENAKNAKGVLLNISGGEDMTLKEIHDIMGFIQNEVGSDNTEIITGIDQNPEYNGRIEVTVIAAGIPEVPKIRKDVFEPYRESFPQIDTENEIEETPAFIRRKNDNDEFLFIHEKERTME
jgi:cell division protein FtsZ